MRNECETGPGLSHVAAGCVELNCVLGLASAIACGYGLVFTCVDNKILSCANVEPAKFSNKEGLPGCDRLRVGVDGR